MSVFKPSSSQDDCHSSLPACAISVLFLCYLLGDYGKLGHGNNVTQKLPRLILGPFAVKVCTSTFVAFLPVSVTMPFLRHL